MSNLLIIPIVVAAIFMVYRHIKGAFGSGACHNCPSRDSCGINATHGKHSAPEAPYAAED